MRGLMILLLLNYRTEHQKTPSWQMAVVTD
jgi:hypothetical protein